MAARRKRGGGGKGKLPLPPRSALLLSLVVEAVSLAAWWLVVGNLTALGLVERTQLWLLLGALAGCLIGWFCFRLLARRMPGSGWSVLAWLLFVALAAIELKLLGDGFTGSFSISG